MYRVWVCTVCKRYLGDQTEDVLNLDLNHQRVCKKISSKDRYVDKWRRLTF